MSEKRVLVRQTRSTIGRHHSQLATLKCLGLGRIGKSKEHRADASIVGMLKKVSHLVQVSEIKE